MNDRTYTVSAVSRLAGVSVRTLHHYDRIGLLAPAGRNTAGYRLYSPPDLGRLQQILFYRAIGFPLAQIARIMADPGQDSDDHLRRQHRLLREQISHRQDMLAAIEKELEARKMGITLTPEEQFEIFGTDKVGGEWADEAEQRWGDSQAWKQSQRRAAAYSKQDWMEIQAEAVSVNQRFLDAMRSGAPADSGPAMDAAEEHRQHITRRFYACDHAMHRGLAKMILNDERFGQNYDEMAPGLAQYVHDSILANAARATRS